MGMWDLGQSIYVLCFIFLIVLVSVVVKLRRRQATSSIKKTDTDLEGGSGPKYKGTSDDDENKNWGSWDPVPSQHAAKPGGMKLSAAGQAKRKARFQKIRERERRHTPTTNIQPQNKPETADMFASMGIGTSISDIKTAKRVPCVPNAVRKNKVNVGTTSNRFNFEPSSTRNEGWYPADDLSDDNDLNF